MTAPDLQYVHTRPRFLSLLEALRASGQVALDTEFIGEGSYEPQLCLVQIATAGGVWIVDPLALADLGELWQLVTDPERELVVLAAREEIRFCLRYAGRPPGRLLDVQLAAGLVGHGYPLSHTNLVRKVLGVEVSGGESFTDWRQRPLSNRQLEYAADDVRYLLGVRERLLAKAERLGRVHWVEGECRRLVERITAGEQEERWWKVSGSAGLGRRELATLRELWRWRDAEARGANVPSRRVLRDELLVEIAKRRPASTGDLFALRGLDRGAARTAGPAIVAAVQRARQLPDSELPSSMRRDDPPQLSSLTQLLGLVANSLATERQIDPALLATTADLQDLVRWRLGPPDEEEPGWLAGWRGEILRDPLLEILDGRRGVRVGNPNSVNPFILEPEQP
jgi:ribonuclease D